MIGTESALETVSFYVNGKWESAGDRTMHPVTNPATGDAIAQVAYASAADVDRAVQAAQGLPCRSYCNNVWQTPREENTSRPEQIGARGATVGVVIVGIK